MSENNNNLSKEQLYKKTAEKLYKMYIIKNREDYAGAIAKYECVINNERGMFKERYSTRSKDHILEQVAYELAKIMHVPCCKASCRKIKDLYGSFSRFELIDMNKVAPFLDIAKKDEMRADEILEYSLRLTHGNINSFVLTLYKYIIFDYIMGQQDRHNGNLSIFKNDKGIIQWYPLYDNGLCCFSVYENDLAKSLLGTRFYTSRMGDSELILESIYRFRSRIYPGNLSQLINYTALNEKLILDIIDKSDKYNQMGKDRRDATAQFIMEQAMDIHKINIGQYMSNEDI